MEKHVLIFIHGMGIGGSYYSYESLWNLIGDAYCQIYSVTKNKFNSLFEPVYVNWESITYEAKRTVFKAAFPNLEIQDFSFWDVANPMRAARHFMTFFLGDVTAYVSCNDNNIRREVWRTIEPYTKKSSYSIIAHSLGSVIAFDYLFNLMEENNLFLPQAAPEIAGPEFTASEQEITQLQDNFCSFFTFGSPIGLFMLRKGELWKHDHQFSTIRNPVKSEPAKGIERTWLNFYDQQDVLAFPLERLFAQNATNAHTALKDILVDTGNLIVDSHTHYWQNKEVAQQIAQALQPPQPLYPSSSPEGSRPRGTTFLQQIKAIDSQGTDPKQVAQTKAGLIGKWMQENPLEFFGELWQQAPIFPTPLFTIATHYTDVLEVFHADEVFTIDAFQDKILRNIGPFVLGMNNSPEYERQKSILRIAFPREDGARFRQIVAEESTQLLAQIAASETFDLVSQYARILPALVMGRYLGLEVVPPETILQWTRPIFRDIFANVINDPQIEQEANAAHADAVTLLDELIVRRHAQPTSAEGTMTVLDRLLEMQSLASTRLTDQEVRNCLLAFFVATLDLTAIAIISAVVELLSRPTILTEAQRAAGQDSDAAIAGYVWEALRFRPPGTGLFRTCTKDYILGRGTPHQTQIKAGTLIYAASAAAMHDQTQIEMPTEFRVGRPQASYLFFESGIHSCLGKYFSQVQIPLAVKGLLRLGKLEVAGALQKDRGFPESLPVKLIRAF